MMPTRRKPDARVAADRRLVGRRRVDGEAVVPAVTDQMEGKGPHGVAADAAVVDLGVEEDVDGGVAVVGLSLLRVLDHAAHSRSDEDGEEHGGRIFERPRLGVVDLTPPAADLRPGADEAQRR
jgi:hypothetical protein